MCSNLFNAFHSLIEPNLSWQVNGIFVVVCIYMCHDLGPDDIFFAYLDIPIYLEVWAWTKQLWDNEVQLCSHYSERHMDCTHSKTPIFTNISRWIWKIKRFVWRDRTEGIPEEREMGHKWQQAASMERVLDALSLWLKVPESFPWQTSNINA